MIAADCRFLTDACITAGRDILTSASNPFGAEDVGKLFLIGGLSATIEQFNNAGEVKLSAPCSVTHANAQAHYGTDDSNAINDEIQAIKTSGGIIELPIGYILASVNMTDTDAVTLRGKSWGMNGQGGTVLVPKCQNIVDLTAAAGPTVERLQIGTPKSGIIPDVGLLGAQKAGSVRSSCLEIERVFIVGDFAVAGLYAYGVDDAAAKFLNVWNRIGSGKRAAIFTAIDGDGVSSAFQQIATGMQNGGNWHITKGEFHDHRWGGGHTTGNAILFRRQSHITLDNCLVDSSSSDGNVRYENVNGGGCGWHSYRNCAFYTENGTPPKYNFSLQGDVMWLHQNCTYQYSLSVKQGAGSQFPNGNASLTVI